jgi:pimeloyl-ACP methyl ester carboxylesterase
MTMNIQERSITVQGLNIHYLQAGEAGSPVVLLHGAGTDSARLSWGELIGPLSAEHRVWAPDLPGYGESDRPDSAYDTDFYLGFVQSLLDGFGLARTSMVGLSMGGALALGTTLRTPARVDRLVLVDSYGLQRTVAMQPLSYLMVVTPGVMEATWALTRRSRNMARAGLSNVFHDVAAAPTTLIDEVYAEAQKPHAGRAFTRYQRADVTWSGLRTVYLNRLGEIRAPTQIVHGRQDKGVPVACAEEAHRLIGGSLLHIIDGAGHWSQREKPDEVGRVVREFLKD